MLHAVFFSAKHKARTVTLDRLVSVVKLASSSEVDHEYSK